MTQDEKWQKMYDQIMQFMLTNKRRPSKYKADEKVMVNWLKHNRKLRNSNKMQPERLVAFCRLMAEAAKVQRINQYAYGCADTHKGGVGGRK